MKKIFIITVLATSALSACSGFLDINQNPNTMKEEDLTADMIMPAAEMNFAASYGNFLRTTGGYFAEHYVQLFGTSNYLDFSQFTMSATRSSGTYTQIMTRCLNSLESIRRKSSASGEWGTYLAATTLRVFAFQTLVDCYGEVPYSEALNPANTAPRFDNGKDIYSGLLSELNNAISKANASDIVCASFLFPDDNRAENWLLLANALKLKILMRISGTAGFDSTELDALVAEDNFPEESVAWAGCWADESGKANPFYQEEFATYFGSTQTNVGLNVALLKAMQPTDSYTDPRLAVYFKANGSNKYWGGVSGTNFSTSSSFKAASFCRPNAKYDDPVSLISMAEINFLLAEYHAAKGNASAKDYYEAAIKASCADAGLESTDADKIITANPWDASNYAKCIGIQKWIDLAGYNSFEAWCEIRRLGYPAFGTTKGSDITDEADSYDASSLVAGELYTPIKCDSQVAETPNSTIQRFPYAESSTSRNSNAPATKSRSVKVFWAK